MSTSTITVRGNSVTLVAMPTSPASRMIEPWIEDSVSVVESIFTGEVQTQEWPGADKWGWMVTMPPLSLAQQGEWESFLMQMRGRKNATQMAHPLKLSPKGRLQGSVPLVDGPLSTDNIAGSQTLKLKGLTPSRFRLLVPGDAFQVGYRWHQVLDPLNSDGSGKGVVKIWPALRERPADGAALIFNRPQGLFRLAQNKRNWSLDVTRLGRMSFALEEFR